MQLRIHGPNNSLRVLGRIVTYKIEAYIDLKARAETDLRVATSVESFQSIKAYIGLMTLPKTLLHVRVLAESLQSTCASRAMVKERPTHEDIGYSQCGRTHT